MRWIVGRLLLVLGPGLLAGCASTTPGAALAPPKTFEGVTGPVAWRVESIGQIVSFDGQRMRWSYTIVLRETAGADIELDRVEWAALATGEVIGGTSEAVPFRRTLRANSETRLPATDTWGWAHGTPFGGALTLRSVMFERRFVGKDGEGRALAVPVRVILDPSVGKRTRPTPAVGPLPAARAIRPDDLGSLAGRWRGSYRVQNFDVPLEVTVREDGSFEAAENDPVTNRFGGTFRVEDGKLAFTQGSDTGTVALHEGGDRRILAGQIRGSRGSPPAAVSYAIRLEAEPK